MADHVFQNQYRMSYLSPRGTGHVDSQNCQWDIKCLSTRYAKDHVKKDNFKEGRFQCKNKFRI